MSSARNSLKAYRGKRDFSATPEPAPRAAKPHREPIFVVQKHDASRLHYDFRLEGDGVLKSWAVPKGPSMDPADKRLAVHVEDHPLDYATFEGDIPEGHYGAGHVEIWDDGTYRIPPERQRESLTQMIEAGRVEVELAGEKLRGRFALVRMSGRRGGKDNWLLIKMKDSYARPAATAGNGATRATAGAPTKKASRRTKPVPATPSRSGSSEPPDQVEATNRDKVWFPDAGLTKGDVFDFYERIAERLLPFLRNRPMTLERLPDGIAAGKPRFWQKHTPAYYPAWVPRVALPSERGEPVEYVLVNDKSTLLYLVNQGVMTFHPWLSRVGSLDRPDFVLFDLDPGRTSFEDVMIVARALRVILQADGVDGLVKTSGKTGLHVLVPWQGKGGFDEARAWARQIAERTAKGLPEGATIEFRKASRGRRVYIDILQNAKGHHAVPPYVVRAVPEASVSMPLHWDELKPGLSPDKFTVKTVFRRLSRQKDDPFAPLLRAFRAG
jgi:bifunctional non-homologous end joining protein LigD